MFTSPFTTGTDTVDVPLPMFVMLAPDVYTSNHDGIVEVPTLSLMTVVEVSYQS
jgi:hypothetical protein